MMRTRLTFLGKTVDALHLLRQVPCPLTVKLEAALRPQITRRLVAKLTAELQPRIAHELHDIQPEPAAATGIPPEVTPPARPAQPPQPRVA